jgi:hypothetical protein
VKLIEQMIKMIDVAADLDPAEKKSFNSGLGNLKQETIGSACRALVSAYCGEADAETFARAYRIRSRLLHEGEPPAGTDFPEEIRKIDWIARKLVLGHVRGCSN